MANGYGTSSGSSTTSTTSTQSKVNSQGQVAPDGYHYMSDGTLMSDAEHNEIYGGKKIQDIQIDLTDLSTKGETRVFSILGNDGAIFSLQVTNEDDSYYNFGTAAFQTTPTKLDSIEITGGIYSDAIKFPAVSDADHYNIYLFAEINQGTTHSNYQEARLDDGSIDINSSKGSNSNLVQKKIYQTADVVLSIGSFSPDSEVTGTSGTQLITVPRYKSTSKIPFSIPFTVTSSRTLTIDKQPDNSDIIAVDSLTIGSAPVEIEGENIYPAVSDTDTVDGDFTAGTTHKIVMDNLVANKMAVGDKITTTTAEAEVAAGDDVSFSLPFEPGAELVKVIIDEEVNTVASVGDRITFQDKPVLGNDSLKNLFDSNVFLVRAINPDGDNAQEFSIQIEQNLPNIEAVTYVIRPEMKFTFTPKLNRQTITVGALNPDTDNTKEFSMVDSSGSNINVGLRDGVTLSFSNQRNYRWPISNIYNLRAGMRVQKGSVFTSTPVIQDYVEETVYNEGEYNEETVEVKRVVALEGAGTTTTPSTPVKSRNSTTNVETTTQTGNIVFTEQALLSFAGDTTRIIASGPDDIKTLFGYDVEFSDLKVELTPITTTTTSAVANSTSVPVAARDGIINGISTVTGIGIDASTVNPTVASGAGSVTGAGTLTLSAAQTLEKGITLTFLGAGSVGNISGNIKIIRAGNSNESVQFDLDRLFTMH